MSPVRIVATASPISFVGFSLGYCGRPLKLFVRLPLRDVLLRAVSFSKFFFPCNFCILNEFENVRRNRGSGGNGETVAILSRGVYLGRKGYIFRVPMKSWLDSMVLVQCPGKLYIKSLLSSVQLYSLPPNFYHQNYHGLLCCTRQEHQPASSCHADGCVHSFCAAI